MVPAPLESFLVSDLKPTTLPLIMYPRFQRLIFFDKIALRQCTQFF
jgi:hypothetical protein